MSMTDVINFSSAISAVIEMSVYVWFIRRNNNNYRMNQKYEVF